MPFLAGGRQVDCLKILQDASKGGRKVRNPYFDLVERFRDQSMPHLMVVRQGEESFVVEGCNMPELEKQFAEAVQGFLRDLEVAQQEQDAADGGDL